MHAPKINFTASGQLPFCIMSLKTTVLKILSHFPGVFPHALVDLYTCASFVIQPLSVDYHTASDMDVKIIIFFWIVPLPLPIVDRTKGDLDNTKIPPHWIVDRILVTQHWTKPQGELVMVTWLSFNGLVSEQNGMETILQMASSNTFFAVERVSLLIETSLHLVSCALIDKY